MRKAIECGSEISADRVDHHLSTSIRISSSTKETPGFRPPRHGQRSESIRRQCLENNEACGAGGGIKPGAQAPGTEEQTRSQPAERATAFKLGHLSSLYESVARSGVCRRKRFMVDRLGMQ